MRAHEPLRTRREHPEDLTPCWRVFSHTVAKRAAMPGALLLTLATASCERSALSDGLPDTQDCSSCHGSPANAAPPKAVNGSWSTTDIGVGAHQAHLMAGHVAAPVACDECHQVPADLLTHPDPLGRPAKMIFGTNASRNGAAPVWNRASASCTNTYCHGATLSGAANRPLPIWTNLDGSQLRCRACHGYPPAAGHSTSSACYTCHGDVVNPNGTIKNLTRHIDGNLDYDASAVDAGVAGATGTGGTGATSTVVTGTGGSP
jgi:predicted CxxxxCH...CXXCH cytochrome family protein